MRLKDRGMMSGYKNTVPGEGGDDEGRLLQTIVYMIAHGAAPYIPRD